MFDTIEFFHETVIFLNVEIIEYFILICRAMKINFNAYSFDVISCVAHAELIDSSARISSLRSSNSLCQASIMSSTEPPFPPYSLGNMEDGTNSRILSTSGQVKSLFLNFGDKRFLANLNTRLIAHGKLMKLT